MKIDISFLPLLAASFMLAFARIGTMVMLLPGLGELSVPVRVRLTVALVLTAVLLPLHRNDYQLDLRSFGPLLAMLSDDIPSLRLLIVGGSLGAKALNERVPAALAMLPADAKRLRCRSGTSFGRLVVPLVCRTSATSSSPGMPAVLV